MPYIKPERQEYVREHGPETPGDLAWLLSEAVDAYVGRQKLSYQICNDVTGALEGVKLEWYDKIQQPYERKKEAENEGETVWERTRRRLRQAFGAIP